MKVFYTIIALIFLASCTENIENQEINIDTTSTKSPVEQISLQIRETPTNSSLFEQRSKEYVKINDIDNAIIDMEVATSLDSVNEDLYIGLSDLYLIKGKPNKSKEQLRKCLSINPESKTALLNMGKLYFYVKDYKESKNILSTLIDIDPNIAEAYFIKGLIAKEIGDTNLIINQMQIAIEKNPDFYEPYNILGILYASKGDSLAIAYYENAKKVQPKNPEPYYNLGYFLQEHNLHERAIQEYNYIIENLDNDFVNAYYNIGYIYLEYLNKQEKAVEYFSIVIEKDFRNSNAYHNRGYAYEKLNDNKNARLDYTTAIKLDQNHELAIMGLNRIDRK